jgi:hypothetical protein
MSDQQSLDAIHAILDKTEWDADMLDSIADIVRQTGREVRDGVGQIYCGGPYMRPPLYPDLLRRAANIPRVMRSAAFPFCHIRFEIYVHISQ